MTDAQVIAEMMAKFNAYRAKWIAFHGTDAGFNDWFSKQVGL